MVKAKNRNGNGAQKLRERHLAEFRRQLALEKFQEERPQLWLQFQRVSKLVDIQNELKDEEFPTGSCFLHASTVKTQDFCVKKITGIDLDTCQVTVEIHGDEELEAGIVVLPLETIEWFGFPARAVPVGIHFEGFTGMSRPTGKDPTPAATGKTPPAGRPGERKPEP